MAQDELVALQQPVSSKNVIETLDSVLSAADASLNWPVGHKKLILIDELFSLAIQLAIMSATID